MDRACYKWSWWRSTYVDGFGARVVAGATTVCGMLVSIILVVRGLLYSKTRSFSEMIGPRSAFSLDYGSWWQEIEILNRWSISKMDLVRELLYS